ncbi:MAG: 50S ribosomal protein L18 [Candidatus Portnoybacteria bacterium CG_4_8_14_3_um_filter_44_10]|uniref:Large ribosomal subunit protein uL18 n=5 Tax=Candidatus Portnoyibacteriota TaxID=1817913 RepID=A0A2H0KTN8_9BACT|nr:MAG: 50S ribosomal protein L18 [Parcubacteria group bacterium CG2_30_44_18]PIQ74655.1 MAG: 50S ribosomal protein L18 [Candidatus Portnoybacteria bacterium CG11_big_fil_rev_8_21_14_0_20_44_10]PIS16511.1 MAG: 50S ribosomal protein L18 [Candidatus Portnoybacteria bacterium CG09_land_8_20_14_0_10_44_13]PIW75133.1 MAG: 50S ribosomal protein L18 [Candidatus Portnoybacteria bacterium CG_4_8_14_3_um_filter_44_10]PIZ69798.1 MAG: 50S ribosomal protein L18 [Candidatus Portnoybacteria bacterium CG_4_10_
MNKKEQRKKRHARIRAKVRGTAQCPRLSVFRSNTHIYVQMINDQNGRVLMSLSDLSLKPSKSLKKVELAREAGKMLAKQAIDKKIYRAVFDRGGYKYHGRIKALAEGAREGGLKV